MFAAAARTAVSATASARPALRASAARRFASSEASASGAAGHGLPIPPKIATPQSVKGPGGSSARMDAVVGFYKSLPKGEAKKRSGSGIRARYFDGANASGKPIVATMVVLFLIGCE